MRVVALSFEVQDRVDDVLQRLRTGQAAVLRHVADEKRRNVLTLRREQQLRRRFAHLTDAARRGLELQREHGLDRIDDDQRRLDAGDLLEDPLEARFGQEIERRVSNRQAFAARLDLMF